MTLQIAFNGPKTSIWRLIKKSALILKLFTEKV